VYAIFIVAKVRFLSKQTSQQVQKQFCACRLVIFLLEF
jgi:hypothetical protein